MPPRKKQKRDDGTDPLAKLRPLEQEAATAQGSNVRLVGRLRSLGPDHIAVLAFPPDTRHLVVRREDVRSARRLEDSAEDPLVEITISTGAPAFLAASTYVGTAVAAVLRALQPGAGGWGTGAGAGGQTPFVLATPHHAPVAYYPRSLGGNVPLGAPPAFAGLERGRTDFLNDRITLPEGPVGPPQEDEEEDAPPPPPETAPPQGGKGTDFLNDPITLPEGFQATDPLLDATPPQATDPRFDALFPPATGPLADPNLPPPATDPFLDAVLPPPPSKSPFEDLVPPALRKITFGFDPFRLDYTFDF